ncbi:MAG: hypothetical protein J1F31_03060 [Erysipelotrichales bacterium]|nr:hypothetical protein [Erysipelotrichales bacterium]
MKTANKVLLIISCVALGWMIIPLFWLIPVTVHYFHAVRDHRPVSTAYKVCVLLFINMLAGILMLVDNED